MTSRPIVFVLPGLRGDEPSAAAFRAALSGYAEPLLIDHPGPDRPAALLTSMAAIGRQAADTIARHQPEGALRIVGMSFGACVAYEAAAVLRERGREIRGLALFDPPLGGQTPAGYGASSRWRRLAVALLGRATQSEAFKDGMLGLAARGGARQRAEWFLTGFLRRQAIARWRPEPLVDVRALVILSTEFAEAAMAQVRRLLPAATPVTMPGGHAEVLAEVSPELLDHLALTTHRADRAPRSGPARQA